MSTLAIWLITLNSFFVVVNMSLFIWSEHLMVSLISGAFSTAVIVYIVLTEIKMRRYNER